MATTSGEKRHAACDECRQRKLKCSGESSGCSRCVRDSLQCVYSVRSTMGRPPKRRREEESSLPTQEDSSNAFPSQNKDPSAIYIPLITPESLSIDPANAHDPSNFDFISNADMPSFNFGDESFLSKATAGSTFPTTVQPAQVPKETLVQNGDMQGPSSMQQVPAAMKCSCLSNVLAASSGLEGTVSGAVGFPQSLAPLKKALAISKDIISCKACTTTHSPVASWRQNTLYMIALLGSVACKFDELLRAVDAEAACLDASHSKKAMRIGEQWSPDTVHLHTGGPDCPMGFEMEFGAAEWRSLAFRAIKAEVSALDDNERTLVAMVVRLELRQRIIHAFQGLPGSNASHEHVTENPHCVKLTQSIWATIHSLPD